jgi:hypothetical protein
MIAPVPTMDGISVGVNFFDVEDPPYVIANNNDGTLKKVDLTALPRTVEQILGGGTRGDFSVVGYDGCIYATQTDRVVRIANIDGNCPDLYPTCPNKVPTVRFLNPADENVTLGTNFCAQVSMSDNPESLSWSCKLDWGESAQIFPCQFTQNPQTITICHTYNDFFSGFLPITITVTDDQRFPASARKNIQLVRAPPPTIAGVATSSTVAPSGSGATVSPSGSGATVSPSGSGATVSPSGSGATVSPSGSGATVSPSGSGATVSPSGSGATVSPSGTRAATTVSPSGTVATNGASGVDSASSATFSSDASIIMASLVPVLISGLIACL